MESNIVIFSSLSMAMAALVKSRELVAGRRVLELFFILMV